MSLDLWQLDEQTRLFMADEFERDLSLNQLHISPYLSGQGIHDFENLLRQAIEHGDETTLADALRQKGRVARTGHRRQPKGGYSIVTVPQQAAEMIAEDAFNRYYIRALCRRALAQGIEEVVVYRAKPVVSARPHSEALLETTVDPAELLADLREHTGEETDLSIPGGPNSGISVHLP